MCATIWSFDTRVTAVGCAFLPLSPGAYIVRLQADGCSYADKAVVR